MKVLDEIIELSHRYGTGTDWVIAGGGNSSVKTDRSMWVKASGTTLGEISPEEFVEMDRARLAAIWETDYPAEADTREARALADLLAARVAGKTAPRPSVETLMHALFPQRLVFHTHPTLLNGLGCAAGGESAAARLFGDRCVWVPTVNPGFTLAHEIRRLVESWRAIHDREWPQILIMQNHGLVVAGETVAEIDDIHQWIVALLEEAIVRRPNMEPATSNTAKLAAAAEAILEVETGASVAARVTLPFSCPELLRRSESPEAFRPIASAFTPDHIVYSGHAPCYVGDLDQVPGALAAYRDREDSAPKIVVLRGHGAISLGTTRKKAELARLLFLDTLKVACYAEGFGGSLFMPGDQIEFIRGWEVERFREQQSSG